MMPGPDQKAILVVEDQPEVREVAAAALTLAGYAVVAAENGVEALAQLKQHSFDLLLTDVMMPQMDGFTLAERAKLLRPKMAVIYMTGHQDNAPGLSSKRYGTLLYKPFLIDKLLKEIARALAPKH